MKSLKSTLIVVILGLFVANANAIIVRTNIDFSVYDQKIMNEFKEPKESIISNINGLPKVFVGYEDYLLTNWKVELGESSALLQNILKSYTLPVQSKRFGTVLGARVHFPAWNNNSYAVVKHAFPIQVYDSNGNFVNVENGVMPNVSEIQWIALWVNGRNFNQSVAVRFRDKNNQILEYFMGPINFDGWRRLVWINPYFTDRVDFRILRRDPLYPHDIPYLVFDSFVIYRPAEGQGGDSIVYFKSVEMAYAPYIIDKDEDIVDEQVWGILKERGLRRSYYENRKLTEEIYLRKQEEERLKQMR